jgi:hypothetical protein
MILVAKLFDLQFIHRRFLIPLAWTSSLPNLCVPSSTGVCSNSSASLHGPVIFQSNFLPAFLSYFCLPM